MKPSSIYTGIFFGSLVWLHYWADTPKAMVVCGIVAACSFAMAAVHLLEERVVKQGESISRLWERVNPPMYQDSDLPS